MTLCWKSAICLLSLHVAKVKRLSWVLEQNFDFWTVMKLWKTFGVGLNVSFFMIGALGIIETGSWMSEFEWKVSPICLDSWTLGPHLAIIVLEGLGSMAYAGRSTYVTRDGLWEWISLTLSLFSIYCCGLSYSYSW